MVKALLLKFSQGWFYNGRCMLAVAEDTISSRRSVAGTKMRLGFKRYSEYIFRLNFLWLRYPP
jgi:hypothetical protein